MCSEDFKGLEHDYQYPDQDAETFSELPEQVKRDLEAWLNVKFEDPDWDEDLAEGEPDPDAEDKQRLLELYQAGKFQAWTCPECDLTRCYWGEPDDWDHFQGAWQLDFSSYPGPDKFKDEYLAAMCDDCRMAAK